MRLWDRLRDALGAPRATSARGAHAVSRIEYDREPRPEWQAALDAQHVPGTSRVVIAWEPGDVWQPIHRWFLWQVQPWHLSENHAVKQELRGPHPRSTGHYCAPQSGCGCVNEFGVPTHTMAWKGGQTKLIDRQAWALHRRIAQETGELVIPRRLWVIQGAQGGHPFQISMAEQKHRRELGLPADVPSAGDLPYAEFDPRVLVALERYDLWRYAHGLGNPVTAAARATLRRMSETEQAAHRLMWSRWEGLSEEWADGAAHAARQDGLHLLRWNKVGHKARGVDMAALREQYITDTDVEAA